jgi:ATP synthase subunit a
MIKTLEGLNFGNILNPDFAKMITPEFITSLIAMSLIIVFSFVVFFKQRKVSALDKPKGIVNLAEMVITFADKNVSELMGCPKYFSNFGAYVIPLALYIFFGFFVGFIGIPNLIVLGPASEGYIMNESKLFATLPSPFTNLTFTLLPGLITVCLIEFTKLRTNKWNYYKQFIYTFPPLFPLVTNFVPMISLGIRLFGNAFAGFCVLTLSYQALYAMIDGFGLLFAPFINFFLHFYFDLFGGFIQTIVFLMITMMNVGLQAPEEEDEKIVKAVNMRGAVELKHTK